jgi:poly-gamma-glutamate synthesis protein (capsule biosynthesis protein)
MNEKIADYLSIVLLLVLILTALYFLIYSPQYSIPNKSEIYREEKPISQNPKEIAPPTTETNKTIKLLFTGDVMLDRTIEYQILEGANPFQSFTSLFEEQDYVVINLECNISHKDTGQKANKLYNFKANPKVLNTLVDNNINIVNLANNHSMDYGSDALLEQMSLLNEKSIQFVGAGRNTDEAFHPIYLAQKDTRIAILAFNNRETWITNANKSSAGTAYFDKNLISKALKNAQERSDLMIVLPHWGNEYETKHSTLQEEYAKFFIDNGADIVIGNHPHVTQDTQEYKDKKIYYSLGNFVFDGMSNQPGALEANLLELTIKNNQILKKDIIEVSINSNGFPQ